MAEDHLDKEVSVSGKLTPDGVEAKARTRTIAAIDRFLGNIVDDWNTPRELRIAEERAASAGRIKLINALVESGIQLASENPEKALEALANTGRVLERRYHNKQEVIAFAIEDLASRPPSLEESSSGPDALEEDFCNRFERYAEDASSEALREKWGRVLAAEIRSPGNTSPKIMRLVDELDHQTAQIFEALCQHNIEGVVPLCLSGSLPFNQKNRLVDYGLIYDPTLGHIRKFSKASSNSGEALVYMTLGDHGLALVVGDGLNIPQTINNDAAPVQQHDDGAAMPIYILTDSGKGISKILEDKSASNRDALFKKVAAYVSPTRVVRMLRSGNGYDILGEIAPDDPH